MALVKRISSLIELKLKFARDTSYKQKIFDELIDLSSTAKEMNIQSYAQVTTPTDKSLLVAEIPNIKAIYMSLRSVDTSSNDDPATATIKVNGSTAFNCDHLFLRKDLGVVDYLNISTLTFSSAANIETEVLVIILGDN